MQCVNDTECGPYGSCDGGACVCQALAGSGGVCFDLWKNDPQWLGAFHLVYWFGAVIYGLFVVAFGYIAYGRFKHEKRAWMMKSVLVELIVLHLVRFVALGIDPRGVNDIIGPVGFSVMVYFSVQLYMIASFSIVYLWAVMIRLLLKFERSYAVIISKVVIVLLIVLTVPVVIWNGIEATQRAEQRSQLYVGVVTLAFIVIFSIFGWRYLRLLKSFGDSVVVIAQHKKDTYRLFAMDAVFVFFVFYAVIRVAIGDHEKHVYTVMEGIGLLLQFAQSAVFVAYVYKEVGDKEEESDATAQTRADSAEV